MLEPGGQVNAFPKAQYRPVTPADLNLPVPADGLPLPLVMDGCIQQDNLRRAKLTNEWLAATLEGAGFHAADEVLFSCLNCQGELLVQGKGRTQAQVLPVLEAERAVW